MWMNKYVRVFSSLNIFEFFVWLNVFFSLGVRGLVRNLSIKAARSNPPILLHYTPCTNPTHYVHTAFYVSQAPQKQQHPHQPQHPHQHLTRTSTSPSPSTHYVHTAFYVCTSTSTSTRTAKSPAPAPAPAPAVNACHYVHTAY